MLSENADIILQEAKTLAALQHPNILTVFDCGTDEQGAFVVTEFLEGDLTKIKSAVVSRRTCAEVSKETGLVDILIIGKGIHSREQMPSSLAAAVYESIVASIYLDGGFEVVKEYVLRTIVIAVGCARDQDHGQVFRVGACKCIKR